MGLGKVIAGLALGVLVLGAVVWTRIDNEAASENGETTLSATAKRSEREARQGAEETGHPRYYPRDGVLTAFAANNLEYDVLGGYLNTDGSGQFRLGGAFGNQTGVLFRSAFDATAERADRAVNEISTAADAAAANENDPTVTKIRVQRYHVTDLDPENADYIAGDEFDGLFDLTHLGNDWVLIERAEADIPSWSLNVAHDWTFPILGHSVTREIEPGRFTGSLDTAEFHMLAGSSAAMFAAMLQKLKEQGLLSSGGSQDTWTVGPVDGVIVGSRVAGDPIVHPYEKRCAEIRAEQFDQGAEIINPYDILFRVFVTPCSLEEIDESGS